MITHLGSFYIIGKNITQDRCLYGWSQVIFANHIESDFIRLTLTKYEKCRSTVP